MGKTLKITLITVVAFGIHFLIDSIYFKDIRGSINEAINQFGISHNISYLIVGIPIFVGALLISKWNVFFNNLGLDKSFLKALLFASICTLPMFLGFSLFFEFNKDLSLNRILIAVIAAGFFEELYFRGFLFGQLYRHTSLGFIASVLLGALLFGLIHLYQSNDLIELAGIFIITFLGAILFAWVYVEWNYNLWIPILLHALMNLAWEMFNVSDNALGGVYSNIFRTVSIAFIIGITVLYKKQKRVPLDINKDTFLIRKSVIDRDSSSNTKTKVAS